MAKRSGLLGKIGRFFIIGPREYGVHPTTKLFIFLNRRYLYAQAILLHRFPNKNCKILSGQESDPQRISHDAPFQTSGLPRTTMCFRGTFEVRLLGTGQQRIRVFFKDFRLFLGQIGWLMSPGELEAISCCQPIPWTKGLLLILSKSIKSMAQKWSKE
jgi:hypothetical protein